ncbi:MAG: hypothetical protein LBV46_03575, partial [Bacteroidales bacterium]|nr:hypothetical protein [Bacteroidales bacterium]
KKLFLLLFSLALLSGCDKINEIKTGEYLANFYGTYTDKNGQLREHTHCSAIWISEVTENTITIQTPGLHASIQTSILNRDDKKISGIILSAGRQGFADYYSDMNLEGIWERIDKKDIITGSFRETYYNVDTEEQQIMPYQVTGTFKIEPK